MIIQKKIHCISTKLLKTFQVEFNDAKAFPMFAADGIGATNPRSFAFDIKCSHSLCFLKMHPSTKPSANDQTQNNLPQNFCDFRKDFNGTEVQQRPGQRQGR